MTLGQRRVCICVVTLSHSSRNLVGSPKTLPSYVNWKEERFFTWKNHCSRLLIEYQKVSEKSQGSNFSLLVFIVEHTSLSAFSAI